MSSALITVPLGACIGAALGVFGIWLQRRRNRAEPVNSNIDPRIARQGEILEIGFSAALFAFFAYMVTK